VPVLGVVENMSYMLGEDGKHVSIFGQGGGKKLATEAKAPFLGEIPIDPRVAECGDHGEPIVQKHPDSPAGKACMSVGKAVVEELKKGTGLPDLPGLQI